MLMIPVIVVTLGAVLNLQDTASAVKPSALAGHWVA
jgi:hypothetical protein